MNLEILDKELLLFFYHAGLSLTPFVIGAIKILSFAISLILVSYTVIKMKRESIFVLSLLGISLFFTFILSYGMKQVVKRERPNRQLPIQRLDIDKGEDISPTDYSFPSVSTSLYACFTSIMLIFFRHSFFISFFACLSVINVAVYRVVSGAHFVTDVLTGVLLGFGVASGCYTVIAYIIKNKVNLLQPPKF